MIVDPVVKSIARTFAGGSESFPALIQAVVDAEGGLEHILAAVRCSTTVDNIPEALEILCRSAVHHLSDVAWSEYPAAAVQAFGATWAPLGAPNDPHGLNANWTKNVLALWTEKPV